MWLLNSPTLIDRVTDYDSRRVTPMNSGNDASNVNTGDSYDVIVLEAGYCIYSGKMLYKQ